jgi:AraC-like DNA-binding protein
VQKAFEDLLRAGQRTQDAKRLGALHLEILLLIIAGSSGPAAVRSQRAFLTFTRCRQHLEEHFLRIKTAEEAARECHIDAAYLCRLFARFARQSPYGFLQRLQMNHAAALLEGGQHLVREVADVFGMDPFHFSRTFKRVHSVPPSIFIEERLRPSEKHRSRSESAR